MATYDEHWFERWFGANYDADTAVRCLQTLDDSMRRSFRTPLERSPGLTGILAWRRTSGEGWTPLPRDLQTLIRETTGQGRFELCPVIDPLPALYTLDLRLAYAASALAIVGGHEWRHEERPAGGWDRFYPRPIRTHDGIDCLGYLGYTPARYRVRYSAPDGWAHVGLLPYWHGQGWQWPTNPDGLETWADAVEVRLAIEYGWRVEILERLICVDEGPEQRPLRAWATKLLDLWQAPVTEVMQPLWQRAVRAILLQTIGLFAYRPPLETRRVAVREEIDTHALAQETYREVEGGAYEFEDYAVTYRMNHLMHPEFATAVWADTRVRLLRQRTLVDGEPILTGALTVPRERIVGLGLDALYLTHDPGWPDDGKAGRYRLKTHTPGPMPAPKTRRDLEALTGG